MKGEQKEKVATKILKHLTNVLIAVAMAVFVFVVINF